MHELSLSEGVLELIEASASKQGFSRVLGVRLEIGELACVDADALRFTFEAVTEGTLAANAALDISAVPGEAWCESCARTVRIANRIEPCPNCNGFGLRVTGGADMQVKSLEVA